MKLLFCYDGPISKDKENNYYGVAINNNMLSKYEIITKDINVAIKTKGIDDNEKKNRLSLIDKEKYNIIECPNLSSIKGIIFNRKKCKRILIEQIKKSDFIIARLPSIVGNLSIIIARKLNKPYLVELVGCPWDALWNHSIKGKIIAPIMTILTKNKVKKAPYVLYVSNVFLQKRYPTKGKQIGCSDVELMENDNSILQNRIDKINNYDRNRKIIIGTCAALNVKYKGQEYVIKAIAKLKKIGYSNIEYQLVGSGDYSRLMSIAQKYNVLEKINVIGPKPHSEIFDWLDRIDIYIQPSNQEGLCRAVVEAMSRACPCIVSDAGGNPELIDKEFIFKCKKTNMLIEEIKKMIVNKDKMVEQSKINFYKSQRFNSTVLEARRKMFFKKWSNNE